jgi:hypothetical protein
VERRRAAHEPDQEDGMETSTIIAIVVAVIVIGAIIAFVMARSGARREAAKRDKAAEIREQATEHDRHLREKEASATEAEARSALARAEAQKQQLEAERLAAEARERSGSAESVRRERDEQLRQADLHDPDVRTDKEGYRLGDDGNRLESSPDAASDGAAGRGFPADARHDDAHSRDVDGDPSSPTVQQRDDGDDIVRDDSESLHRGDRNV